MEREFYFTQKSSLILDMFALKGLLPICAASSPLLSSKAALYLAQMLERVLLGLRLQLTTGQPTMC